MPVIGAVLVVSPGADLSALAQDGRFTLGERANARVPVVLSTTTRREDLDAWDQVLALPGVLDIQPVFADFSDLNAPREVQP